MKDKLIAVYSILGVAIVGSMIFLGAKSCSSNNQISKSQEELYKEADADTLGLDDESEDKNDQFVLQKDGKFLVGGKYNLKADEHGLSLTVPKLSAAPYFIIRFIHPTAVFTQPTIEGIKYYKEYPCYNLSEYKDEKDGKVTFYTKKQDLLPVCVTEENLPQKIASAYVLSEVSFDQIQKEIEFDNLYDKVFMITLVVNQNGNDEYFGCYSSDKDIFNHIMSGMLHEKLY